MLPGSPPLSQAARHLGMDEMCHRQRRKPQDPVRTRRQGNRGSRGGPQDGRPQRSAPVRPARRPAAAGRALGPAALAAPLAGGGARAATTRQQRCPGTAGSGGRRAEHHSQLGFIPASVGRSAQRPARPPAGRPATAAASRCAPLRRRADLDHPRIALAAVAGRCRQAVIAQGDQASGAALVVGRFCRNRLVRRLRSPGCTASSRSGPCTDRDLRVRAWHDPVRHRGQRSSSARTARPGPGTW